MLVKNYDNYMLAYNLIGYDAQKIINNGEDRSQFLLKDRSGNSSIPYSYIHTWGSQELQTPFTDFIIGDYHNPGRYDTNYDLDYYSNDVGESLLWCGSGTKEVSYDDYDLQSPFNWKQIESTGFYFTRSYNSDTRSWILSYTRVFKAVSTVDINEVGIYCSAKFTDEYGNSADSYGRYILFYREVLPETISIIKDDRFKLTFTISLPIDSTGTITYSTGTEIVNE